MEHPTSSCQRHEPRAANAQVAESLLSARHVWFDEYLGTPDELCSAGLVRPGQFPGQPGRLKSSVTYFVADGLSTPHGFSSFEPTYTVQRRGGGRFSVSVGCCGEEVLRRKGLAEKGHDLPLQLPGQAAAAISPPWAPQGWAYRGRRLRDGDYVFVVSWEHIQASGLLAGQPSTLLGPMRRTVRFTTNRFGAVTVAHRAQKEFLVALGAPLEIRYAEYGVREFRVDGNTWCVVHTGTKTQLQEHGFGVGQEFPGDPGRSKGSFAMTDSRMGRQLTLSRLPRLQWCGDLPRFEVVLYRATVERNDSQAASEEARLERLKALPATPDAYREKATTLFWDAAHLAMPLMQAKEGYRFAPEVVEMFIDGITEAYWVLRNGDIHGESPRLTHQRIMVTKAKADLPLQRLLSTLQKSDAN